MIMPRRSLPILWLVFWWFTLFSSTQDVVVVFADTVVHRINCGGILGASGWDTVDGGGWEPDDAYLTSPGRAATRNKAAFARPVNLFPYQTERIDQGDTPLAYTFANLVPGNYRIEFLWTEVQFVTPHARVMNVSVQGVLVLPAFDIFVASGNAALVPLVVPVEQPVVVDATGLLTITLAATVNNAKLNGLIVTRLDPNHNLTTTTPTWTVSDAPSVQPTLSLMPSSIADISVPSVSINCAGPDFVDSFGTTWLADDAVDTPFRVIGNRRTSNRPYVGVADQDLVLYSTRAQSDDVNPEIVYQVNATEYLGTTTLTTTTTLQVSLVLVEPFTNRPAGTRLMDVFLQDNLVQAELDVFAEAGNAYWVPIHLDYVVVLPPNEEMVTVRLTSVTGRAILQALQVSALAGPTTPAPTTVTPTLFGSAMPSLLPSMEPSRQTSSQPSKVPSVSAHASDAPSLSNVPSSSPFGFAVDSSEAPSTTSTPTLAPSDYQGPVLRLNCGGEGLVDANGDFWEDDTNTGQYRMEGKRRNGDHLYPSVALADQALYNTRAEGVDTNVRYEFNVTDFGLPSQGRFLVQLFFAEPHGSRGPGDRVFHVFLQDVLVQANFDIFVAGGNVLRTPLVLEFHVTVQDVLHNANGFLSVELQAVVGRPILQALLVQPSFAPTLAPTVSPAPTMTALPTNVASVAPTIDADGFQLYLNVGGAPFVHAETGRQWQNDSPLYSRRSEGTLETTEPIQGAAPGLESLYQSARYGTEVTWRIEGIPSGDYNIIFHLAEINGTVGALDRIFSVTAEDPIVLSNVDIAATVGQFAALVINRFVPSVDNTLVIRGQMPLSSTQMPLVAGLEILQNFPHAAHSVPGGPYMAVARDASNMVAVPVNGGESHTHQLGSFVNQWNWFLTQEQNGTTTNTLLVSGEMPYLILPIGMHTVTLQVQDTMGDTASEITSVLVQPQGFPFVDVMTPMNGQLNDTSYNITLTGVGFTGAELIVHFGPANLYASNASQVLVVSDTELILLAPIPRVRATTGPVNVYLETAVGLSNPLTFTQYDEPFFFATFELVDAVTQQPYYMFQPTCLTYGPDQKLYVGTRDGVLHKLTVDENWVVTEAIVSNVVADQSILEDDKERSILGMTFDPLDTSENPTLYISTSILSHDEPVAWERLAINGRVVKVSGANLDTITNVVTGLPLLDRDHSVAGLEFGDNGQLYINNGGNTNAGIPGRMSGTNVQEEGFLSGACNVAHLSRPSFDGAVTYDSVGDKVGGVDVEGFAFGTRNPYDLVLHSNGYIYGTDNGPNQVYGPASATCDTEGDPEPGSDDELNLLESNGYYGHPNRKRGELDPRQCVYHHPDEESSGGYTGPMATLPSSVDGITEFKSNHFGGGMRGQLIIGQYRGAMYRVPLTPDGRGIENDEVILFLNFGGLDVTQAPNGALLSVRYNENKLLAQVPLEDPVADMEIKAVFPHRGHLSGGTRLNIFGVNMDTGALPTVTVGGDPCTTVAVASDTKLTCTLPAKLSVGKADLVVDNGLVVKTFSEAYRYITGVE